MITVERVGEKKEIKVERAQFENLDELKNAILEAYEDTDATVLVRSVKSENTLGFHQTPWKDWYAVIWMKTSEGTKSFKLPDEPATIYFLELEK